MKPDAKFNFICHVLFGLRPAAARQESCGEYFWLLVLSMSCCSPPHPLPIKKSVRNPSPVTAELSMSRPLTLQTYHCERSEETLASNRAINHG